MGSKQVWAEAVQWQRLLSLPTLFPIFPSLPRAITPFLSLPHIFLSCQAHTLFSAHALACGLIAPASATNIRYDIHRNSSAFGKSILQRILPPAMQHQAALELFPIRRCISAGRWVSLMLHGSPWAFMHFRWHQMITKRGQRVPIIGGHPDRAINQPILA